MSNILKEFKALSDYDLFSPFFIIALSFILVSATLLIINTKLKNKIIEIIYCSILTTLVICIMYFYRNVIFTALDSMIENIIKSLLFPSFLHILVILLVTILVLFYVVKLFNEKKWLTITVIVVSSILFILNIIILIIISNTDNIYYVYKNRASLLLMQLSTIIFYIYMIFFCICRLKFRNKVKIKEEKKVKRTKEGIEILTLD